MLKKLIISLRDNPFPAILLLAALVRLVFLLFYYYDSQWNQLLVDSLFHNYWAQSIADGEIIGREAFFRAPLYIYILGGLYALFGNSILMARIFGHLCGLLSVYITGRIALKIFGKKAAIIAALIHSIYPIAIYFESELLVDGLFTLLLELSILIFLKALETEKPRWYILTGLVIGLAAITKPTILALVPLYALWLFLKVNDIKKSIILGIYIIITLSIIILPVTIRNFMVADDLVLISSSGGINFYLGNNDSADGYSASMPKPLGHNWQIQDITYIAEKEIGRKMKASEISDYWYARGLGWISENKFDFIRLYLRKLFLCLNNHEISNNRNLNLFFQTNPVLKIIPINFGLILALATASILLIIIHGKMDYKVLPIISFVLAYIVIISMFFINARYRLPVIPLLIIIASYWPARTMEGFDLREKLKSYIITAIAGGVIFAISLIPPSGINANDIASGLFNQANYYLYQGQYEKAKILYKQLLDENPHFPDANLNLGVTHLRLGFADSAEVCFQKEIQFFPDRANGYVNMASIRILKNEYQDAIDYADRAISIKPYLTDAHIIKMRALAARGDMAELQNIINDARRDASVGARIDLEAGIIFSNLKQFDKAISFLNSALEAKQIAIETDDRAFTYEGMTGRQMSNKIRGQAAYQLGYIMGMRNNLIESVEKSRLAIYYDSSLAEAYINLINGYRLLGKTDSARIIYNLATFKFPGNDMVKSVSRLLN